MSCSLNTPQQILQGSKHILCLCLLRAIWRFYLFFYWFGTTTYMCESKRLQTSWLQMETQKTDSWKLWCNKNTMKHQFKTFWQDGIDVTLNPLLLCLYQREPWTELNMHIIKWPQRAGPWPLQWINHLLWQCSRSHLNSTLRTFVCMKWSCSTLENSFCLAPDTAKLKKTQLKTKCHFNVCGSNSLCVTMQKQSCFPDMDLCHQPFHLPSQSFIAPSALSPSPTNFIRNFLWLMTSQQCCQTRWGWRRGGRGRTHSLHMKHIYPSKSVCLSEKVPVKRLNSHPDMAEWTGFDWLLRVYVNRVRQRWCQLKSLYIQTPLLLSSLLLCFSSFSSVFLADPGESQKCAYNSKRGLTAIFSAQGPNVDWRRLGFLVGFGDLEPRL